MKTDIKPQGALRLEPCRYGLSKLAFRGPARPTDDRFVAVLGGADTFGKYIAKPFPDLIETAIGEVCVNLGCASAGPDVFLQDTAVQSLCHDAAAMVLQVLSVTNQTNAFYKVHPRRNDRFIGPTDKLTALFPEVDFAEIAFTGHLIARLCDVDRERFEVVLTHLRNTWVRRMTTLASMANGPVILLWLASQTDDAQPCFVNRMMVDAILPHMAECVVVRAQTGDTAGMSVAPLDELNARAAFGPAVHEVIAKSLRAPLLNWLN